MKKRRILSALLATLTAAGTALGAASAINAADTSPYKDVSTKRWSYDEIMYATENGFMNGKGGGLFAPEETMTRAMVVTVLYRFQGEPEVKFSARFKDVKAKDWFANAVLWAAEKEIVNGVEDGVFAPNDSITRQQLAAILQRYAPVEYIKTEERRDITGYKDYKKVQAYAREAMSWANATGLITGVTTTTLEPASGATREQFAVILQRFRTYDKFDYELAYKQPTYNTELDRTVEPVEDADIYVAVDGKDTNAGTKDSPIATLARAKEMVRELKKTAKDEIVVAFKAGNYGSLDDLTFTAEDAGTASVPIRYTAYGDGDVTFANGTIIKFDDFEPITDEEKAMFPERSQNSIYKVNLSGKVDELLDSNYIFSSTGVCHEARYPNMDPSGTDRCYKNFTTRYEDPSKTEFEYDTIILSALAAKAADSFSTVEGMKVTGFLRTGWLIDTFKVKSYDKETKHLTFDFSNRNCANGYSLDTFCLAFEGRMDDTVFFHNLAEMLDDNGEYWYDTKTRNLYVYNPTGDYTIASAGRFITLEREAEYISFVGLNFNGSTDTALHIFADHTTIDRCSFKNIGAQSVVVYANAMYFTFTSCELSNFVNGGINLSSRANMRLLQEGHNVIENNYFHDFGQPQFFANAHALGIDDVAAKVSHNIFKNGAHGAIRFAGIDNVFEYNVFDNMMARTQDFGAVYTWNSVGLRDNHIRYNIFTNIPVYGIYLDDNTCGQHVYGNLFFNNVCAVVLHGGRENDVHDNVIVLSGFSFTGNTIGESTDTIEQAYASAFATYLAGQRATESDAMYSTWLERWPSMYNYDYDPSHMGQPNCIYTSAHRVRDNIFVEKSAGVVSGSEMDLGETANAHGDVGNNLKYRDDENLFFVDPTHGDYSIRDGADFEKLDFTTAGIQK